MLDPIKIQKLVEERQKSTIVNETIDAAINEGDFDIYKQSDNNIYYPKNSIHNFLTKELGKNILRCGYNAEEDDSEELRILIKNSKVAKDDINLFSVKGVVDNSEYSPKISQYDIARKRKFYNLFTGLVAAIYTIDEIKYIIVGATHIMKYANTKESEFTLYNLYISKENKEKFINAIKRRLGGKGSKPLPSFYDKLDTMDIIKPHSDGYPDFKAFSVYRQFLKERTLLAINDIIIDISPERHDIYSGSLIAIIEEEGTFIKETEIKTEIDLEFEKENRAKVKHAIKFYKLGDVPCIVDTFDLVKPNSSIDTLADWAQVVVIQKTDAELFAIELKKHIK